MRRTARLSLFSGRSTRRVRDTEANRQRASAEMVDSSSNERLRSAVARARSLLSSIASWLISRILSAASFNRRNSGCSSAK